MDRGQRGGQAVREDADRPDAKRPDGGHGVIEGRARDVLGGQPRRRGVRIGVEHGGHERPVQLPARGDLAAEAAAELAVVRETRVDELDGHQLPSPVGR